LERVKVYNDMGMPVLKGTVLFAREFMDKFPLIPLEDEERLYNPDLRENFIERINEYKNGFIHLIVPVMLIGHYVRRYV
jgi:hypothetical protein